MCVCVCVCVDRHAGSLISHNVHKHIVMMFLSHGPDGDPVHDNDLFHACGYK